LEKLIKMSAVFGITIDELVTGNAPSPAETKVIYIERPQKSPISTTRILGIVMFCFSLIFLLLATFIPGIDDGSYMPLFLSCIVLSTALLAHQNHLAFWSCIIPWLASWLFFASEWMVIFALSFTPTCVVWIWVRLSRLWKEQESPRKTPQI
jgi:hypothetical protein